jgi:hypothetical protein
MARHIQPLTFNILFMLVHLPLPATPLQTESLFHILHRIPKPTEPKLYEINKF